MKKPSILIIDDNQKIHKSLLLIFEDKYHVFTASNGRDGLGIIERNNMSLIILDLQMPEMNGLEFLQCVRKVNEDIPVLIMTGHSSHGWAKKCADLNVQGYFEKPYDIEALTSRVRKLLGRADFKVLRRLWKDKYDARMADISHIVRKALYYIHQGYQIEFSRDELAAELRICPDHLSRQFHKECGMHIIEYVTMLRIDKGKEYLIKTDGKINDIASSLGYPNANYFSKLFKKHIGLTPQEFRANHSKL